MAMPRSEGGATCSPPRWWPIARRQASTSDFVVAACVDETRPVRRMSATSTTVSASPPVRWTMAECRSEGDHPALSARVRTATAYVEIGSRRRCAAPAPGRRPRRRPRTSGARSQMPEIDDQLWIARSPGAHRPPRLGDQLGRGAGQQVEALLRIEPADHASTGPESSGSKPSFAAMPSRHPPCRSGRRGIRLGQRRVGLARFQTAMSSPLRISAE